MSHPSAFAARVAELSRQLNAPGTEVIGALFDLTALRLVRLGVAITRNQFDAEDAVQAAMVKVATRPELLRQADCAWSYLLKMVRNESLVTLRKRKTSPTVSPLAQLVGYTRVDELELQDTHRAVWSALRALPAEQAEVVVLKIWEELTFQQIGQVLGLSPNTISSRYQYALQKLAGKLAPRRREVLHDCP